MYALGAKQVEINYFFVNLTNTNKQRVHRAAASTSSPAAGSSTECDRRPRDRSAAPLCCVRPVLCCPLLEVLCCAVLALPSAVLAAAPKQPQGKQQQQQHIRIPSFGRPSELWSKWFINQNIVIICRLEVVKSTHPSNYAGKCRGSTRTKGLDNMGKLFVMGDGLLKLSKFEFSVPTIINTITFKRYWCKIIV